MGRMTAPHGTPDAPLLTVRGEAELDAHPDLARITATVIARGRDRRTALDDLTRRNTAALDLVRSYGDAVAHLSTGTVSVGPEVSGRSRGGVRAYHGRVWITAELTDFTVLGELVARLADLDVTRVDGPSWDLRPDSPVHRRAREQAVQGAVRRAREYAQALGTTLAALVELADSGSHEGRPRAAFERRVVRASAGGAADTPEALDLEPQRMRVRAEVTAQFTMNPPSL